MLVKPRFLALPCPSVIDILFVAAYGLAEAYVGALRVNLRITNS
jgi:hypothetical protein